MRLLRALIHWLTRPNPADLDALHRHRLGLNIAGSQRQRDNEAAQRTADGDDW